MGIGEAAYRAATLVARRFAVITTLRRGIPELEDGLEREGVGSRCAGVVPLDIPRRRSRASSTPTPRRAIVAAGQRAVDDPEPTRSCSPAAGWPTSRAPSSEGVGVPVCDGVAVGVLLAARAVALRPARPASAGAYGRPSRSPTAACRRCADVRGDLPGVRRAGGACAGRSSPDPVRRPTSRGARCTPAGSTTPTSTRAPAPRAGRSRSRGCSARSSRARRPRWAARSTACASATR